MAERPPQADFLSDEPAFPNEHHLAAHDGGIVTLPRPRRTAHSVRARKLLVGAYKLAGLAILTAILLGLISYLGLNVFYLFHHAWVRPTVVSPTDSRVLELSSQLAQQASLRDKLRAERASLQANLDDSQRVLAAA